MERQPLLRNQDDDGPDHAPRHPDLGVRCDRAEPTEWSSAFKWSIVGLLTCMAFTVALTCTSVLPLANRIADELSGGQSNKSASTLLVTIWELGEAIGPLIIAPLSEVFGRYPVLNVATGLFTALTVMAALCQSTEVFIAIRALNGMTVATNVLNPAIVADMFVPEERGSPMSMLQMATLVGGALGPAISGTIADTLGWRTMIWLSVCLAGTCEALFLTFFRETYRRADRHSKIPQREAAVSNATTGTSAYRLRARAVFVLNSITRPAVVLLGSPVLVAMSVFGSVVFAQFYVMSVTLPTILEDNYGLSASLTGLSFLSFSIGALTSTTFCKVSLDRIYIRLRDGGDGAGCPEYRLPLAIIGSFTLPIAMTLYGWVAQLRLALPILLLSVVLIGFTLMLAFIPVMAYVVDAFGAYSASALASVMVARCVVGTFLPLAASPLIRQLGHGWALTVLGSLNLGLAAVPLMLQRHGHKWRQGGAYTKDASEEAEAE